MGTIVENQRVSKREVIIRSGHPGRIEAILNSQRLGRAGESKQSFLKRPLPASRLLRDQYPERRGFLHERESRRFRYEAAPQNRSEPETRLGNGGLGRISARVKEALRRRRLSSGNDRGGNRIDPDRRSTSQEGAFAAALDQSIAAVGASPITVPLVATLFLVVATLATFRLFGPVSEPLPEPIDPGVPATTAVEADLYAAAIPVRTPTGGSLARRIPEQFAPLSVSEYQLVPGDTVSGLAQEFGLRMDTILSFNGVQDARRIRAGDVYTIPNRDGILYDVRSGDSLSTIAAAHGVTVTALLDANALSTSNIHVGQTLFVPDARLNETTLKTILGELFRYPVPAGTTFTSTFGMRPDPFTGERRFHNGIDLAAPTGTAIYAARSGRVVHVETQIGNYGKFIIIDHGDNMYQTLYGHLNSFVVREGEWVSTGQLIGRMGSTGRSTGPHLHFSVIRNGAFVDPMTYLP